MGLLTSGSKRTGWLIALWLFLLTTLLACSGASVRPTPTPQPTEPPTTQPPPRATSTPLPTVVAPRPEGRVLSRLLVRCNVVDFGLEVSVRYGAAIQDTESEVPSLTRIELLVNGARYEDTGPISDRIYAREITFAGQANRIYRIQLNIDTWGAPKPNDFVQVVRCPDLPENPLARVYP